MKRFLINLVVFVSLVLVSCALFMGFANGSADAFYSKFTSSKQSSLIIGSSRASQDVRPKIISDVLDGKPIYNYAFTILHSPYGKAYYTSIIKKVDTTKTDGIFILCVNPWTISTLKKHIHDTTFFRENNSFVDNTNWVNLKPNAEYIIESYEQRNIQLLLNRYRKGSFETINVSKDGWLQVTIEENDFNRKKRTQLKMQTYHEHLNNLLTGISFIDVIKDKTKVRTETNQYNANTWYDDYNSAILINSSDSVQQYNKSKLVVGIENFPYQDILKPLIGDAMIDLGGTVAMKTTQNYRGVFTSSNSKFKVAPIICYESVYGEFVSGYVRNEANFLAIVTNDAWWNETQGHKQHLSYAKLRAIETRRDIVRSANTGISAIINAKGEITSSIAYGEKGALSGQVITNDKITFYVMAGDYIARISIFILLFVGLIGFFRRKKEQF